MHSTDTDLQRQHRSTPRSARRWVGSALMLVGVLGLVYGGLNQSRDGHRASLGAEAAPGSRLARTELPFWLGGGVLLMGGVLVLWPSRR